MLAIYGLELLAAESWEHRTQVLIGFAIQLTDLSACKQFYDGAIVTARRPPLLRIATAIAIALPPWLT